MTEESPEPVSKAAKAEARADEAAAIRRRWITLGEVLTVIAVTISGLTLWNTWSQRSDSEASKSAEAIRASSRAATLVLMATGSGSDELVLKPASDEQSVQSQRIAFPTALGVSAAETTGEPRIEAAWFERALKKARAEAKLPDNSRGDEKLPVLVTTRFIVDGKPHEDVALYDVGYSISGRWLGGHNITLRGVSLVSHAEGQAPEQTGARLLDKRWKALLAEEKAGA
ncbi:hypothetical protein [Novosphingobium kaempferiae]|uniref:hypothetical protein n=1 Tax=Novosphingobium kaempferiae TaxID=2896849 RepID=UPI001E35B5A3|nr:hypothetical protein [Novosphingobium kaempferiae]